MIHSKSSVSCAERNYYILKIRGALTVHLRAQQQNTGWVDSKEMSCNGCRVLRKGCSESCILRPCLQWIETPEAQGHATVFVAKFFGRAGLMSFISNVPESQRPGIYHFPITIHIFVSTLLYNTSYSWFWFWFFFFLFFLLVCFFSFVSVVVVWSMWTDRQPGERRRWTFGDWKLARVPGGGWDRPTRRHVAPDAGASWCRSNSGVRRGLRGRRSHLYRHVEPRVSQSKVPAQGLPETQAILRRAGRSGSPPDPEFSGQGIGLQARDPAAGYSVHEFRGVGDDHVLRKRFGGPAWKGRRSKASHLVLLKLLPLRYVFWVNPRFTRASTL